MQRLKTIAATLALSIGLLGPVAATAMVSADNIGTDNNINQGLCQGVNSTTSTSGGAASNTGCFNGPGTDAGTSLGNLARKVINIFSIIVGIVAVIMIIYGGFRYITSGGSSDKVGGAKNTLIYAIIGLIIVALAQFLVHFVLNTASTSV